MQRLFHWVMLGDARFMYFIHHQLQCRFLDVVMPRITHLGGATCTLSLLLSMILFFQDDLRLWSIEALISLALSHLIVHWIKKGVPRFRPHMALTDIRKFPNALTDYSFPSGHTTAIFAVTTVFMFHSIALSLILMPIAMIVGLSRMYLGLHYLTDVLAGGLLGTLTSLLIVQFSWLMLS